MTIPVRIHWHHELPDTPYNLWKRRELADLVRLGRQGTRAEIIGGRIIVPPWMDLAHGLIVSDVADAFTVDGMKDPSGAWQSVRGQDLDLDVIQDGYTPDLCLLNPENGLKARKAQLKHLSPHHVELVLEVTSPENADQDRIPSPPDADATKWNGYARVGIPHYLLVDRDPGVARTTLFSGPDRAAGEYRESLSWAFGEVVRLPEPFGLEISTDEWEPWI
ncbi:Uma2 family endonuclease [Actinomadura terrae]|uniref:Uma2 family endonuclease n=1 Tax=Actinomadura terrae TaxID=604353 RepID=UPI001FA7523E|nr:Uma2 family endonuclease [Actinomadura terrae]